MLIDFVTTKDAVEILKVAGRNFSQRHIAWLCEKGRIPGAHKMGKTWLIPEKSLKIYLLTYHKSTVRKNTEEQPQ